MPPTAAPPSRAFSGPKSGMASKRSSVQYSDFTKIHFWQHARFKLEATPEVAVVASFDNGDPALWEQQYGDGRVLALAAGWSPQESQLARSWREQSDDPPDDSFLALLRGAFDSVSAEIVPFPNPLLDQESRSTVYLARRD